MDPDLGTQYLDVLYLGTLEDVPYVLKFSSSKCDFNYRRETEVRNYMEEM